MERTKADDPVLDPFATRIRGSGEERQGKTNYKKTNTLIINFSNVPSV